MAELCTREPGENPDWTGAVRGADMRSVLRSCVVAGTALLLFSSCSWAQTPRESGDQFTNLLYDKLANRGPGGPAPRRDLTGFWTGPLHATINQLPPMTPWGQEQFRAHKGVKQVYVADSNDPLKGCDPLGFPRNMLDEIRGIAFAQMPGKMLVLNQYNKLWREISTDGAPLPKNVGGRSADAADPHWYGYSAGRWDGDYSFVVDTVGADERSWLDEVGHPHSLEMRVQERYTRVDHNDLEVAVTIDDPKTYTKPFVISTVKFRWIPEQKFPEEWFCVPSEMAAYLSIVADPAAKGPGKPPKK